MLRLSIVTFLISLSVASADDTSAKIRLDPHHYFGNRGNEPQNQLNIQGELDWSGEQSRFPWRIETHGDFEALGRKDNSVDIDRAWVKLPLKPGPVFILGRVHPYEVSRNLEASRPWGMLSQSHPQNRSIALGSPFTDKVFPEPVLQGWIGAHVWSDATYEKKFQCGLSVAPVFIPSMGSSVDFSSPASSRVGRFARQPPANVQKNGRSYPINYDVDTSEISSEILQPQVMAQTYGRMEFEKLQWETWLAVRRSPVVDPTLDASAKLDIRESNPQVNAKVKPRFPQKWSASLTQKVVPTQFKDSAVFSSIELEAERVGAEVGLDSKYYMASYLTDRKVVRQNGDFAFETAPYGNHLVQVEGRLPVKAATLYGGAKYHLRNRDSWIRGGIRSKASEDLSFDLGMDLFTGRNETYFGEWRSNDRVYVGIDWRFGS